MLEKGLGANQHGKESVKQHAVEKLELSVTWCRTGDWSEAL